jgi:hypothetical protein
VVGGRQEVSDTQTRVYFAGQCPFLTCPEPGRHTHPICSECETVNYGNMRCLTCKTMRPSYNQHVAEGWKAKVLA